LNLLLARSDAHGVALTLAEKSHLSSAIDHALELTYDEYAAQVVAYLEPAQAELFADRSAWDTMQKTLVERLEALS
jgi:hypothetical protein